MTQPDQQQARGGSPIEHRSAFGDTVVRIDTINEEERTIEFVASTEAVDSYRTILRQNWDLQRFGSNPVVLYNHDPGCPLGTAETRIEDKQLIAKVRFATGDKEIDEVWNLVKQKVIRGMSVGFRPLSRKVETINGMEVMVFDKSELYELSITTQPSNAEALSRARNQENRMADPTPLEKAPVAPDTITRSEHEASTRALQSTITELRAASEKLTAECTELRAANARHREEALTRKVDDLVGKKITPAQRDAFLGLARSGDAAFEAIVATLPDLGLVGGSKIPDNGDEQNRGKGGDVALKKIAELTDARMSRTGETRAVAMMAVQKENPDLVEASLWPSAHSTARLQMLA
jgi:HK97 family phage prohead protease